MKYFTLFLFIYFSLPCYSQTTDAQGRKQGYWKKRDDKTNRLLYEGQFKDNLPVGTFKYYHINDSVRAIIQFKNGGGQAYAKLYHMNGKMSGQGKYIGQEVKDSVWTYYDETGTLLSKESYSAGKKTGKSFVYLPDGNVSQERNFKNGLEDGAYVEFFAKDLVRAKGQYLSGEKEGKFIYYYPNKVEAATGVYKKGLKHGVWIYRTQDNKISEKELYKNGVLAPQKEADAYFAKNKTQTLAPKTETKTVEQKKSVTPAKKSTKQ